MRESLVHQGGRKATDGTWILGNNRNTRIQEIRHREVVKANECDAMLRSGITQCFDGPHRDEVLSCEDRGGSIVEREQGMHGHCGLGCVVHITHDELRAQLHSGGGHRVDIPLVALIRGGDARVVTDKGNALVPTLDEMACGCN